MIRKKCENVNCGKFFVTKSELRKYCCKKCRAEARAAREEQDGQPCWVCKKGCGRCSWSQSFTPIKGWVAFDVCKKEEDGYERKSYKIIYCPEFVHI